MMNRLHKTRLVSVPLNQPIRPQDRRLIDTVMHSVQDNGNHVEYGDTEARFYINSLNLKQFTRMAYASAQENTSRGAEILKALVKALEDIGSYGIKSGKRVYAGYADERKVSNRKRKSTERSQSYYAQDHDFSPNNNALPSKYRDSILTGDALNIIKQWSDNCVDIVVTSPPYNFGLAYSENSDTRHWEKYFEQLFAIFDECIRVLKFGGRFIVNVQPLFSDYIPSHHVISKHMIDKKLIWKGEILWEKNNYNCKYTAWGSWKSPSNPYLKYTWEFVEIFCKGTLRKARGNDTPDISADEFKKWVVAKWSIAPERGMKHFGHPAMFPEELVNRLLKLFSFPGDIVLDPFNGVGTTTLVAKKLNRGFVGIDISEQYCATAKTRFDEILLRLGPADES